MSVETIRLVSGLGECVPRLDEQFSAKVLKRARQLGRLGPGGLLWTAYVRLFGPAVYAATDRWRDFAVKFHRQRAACSVASRGDMLRRRAAEELAGPLAREIVQADQRPTGRSPGPRVERVVGTLLTGGVIVPCADIEALPNSPPAALPERGSAKLQLVEVDGRLGVRRHFGDDAVGFLHTVEAMLDLAKANCAVPRILAVDWTVRTVTSEFVRGERWRNLNRSKERERRAREELERLLIEVHHAGYVLDAIDEEDIVWEADGSRPALVGLHHALPLAGASRDMSISLRDANRRKFNELFGTRLVTAARLRNLRSPLDVPEGARSAPVYAPAVVREDIRWGNIWNTDVGIGRWNFIMKQHLPIPAGGSVLDLGSNNGFNPLQMLRSGAASAVGVEIDASAIEQGEFLKSAFEWLDNRAYDFRYIHGSQANLPAFGLPRFDVVTALCSLYYMSEPEMRALARYVRTLSDVLVLQCNTDRLIDRSDEDTFRKASIPFALDLLDQAGYPDRTVVAPPGYSRPLVIGRA